MRATTIPMLASFLVIVLGGVRINAGEDPDQSALAPLVIAIEPGEAPATDAVRQLRIGRGEATHLVDTCDPEATRRVYGAIAADLADAWSEAPHEEIPGLDGLRWATRPVEIRPACRVDYRVVTELVRLAATGANPLDPAAPPADTPAIFKTVRIRHGEDAFTFPMAVSAPATGPGPPPLDIHVRLLPAGFELPGQPSHYDAKWRADPDARTEIVAGRPDPARRLVIDPQRLAAEDRESVTAYREELGRRLREMFDDRLDDPDPDVVIDCFGLLPWRHARLVHDLLQEIDPERRIHFSPSRLRDFHRWSCGNEIFELLHLK